jgi:hypothetical protein
MECVDAATARQRHGNKISAPMDTHAAIEELLGTMFSMWSMPWLYNEDEGGKLVQWLHNSQSHDTVKYGH